MLIANADRLTEIVCHSPNLINTDLSECTKLQRIDLSDCTALGTGIGAQPILNIQNCKYLRYCDCRNTQLTAIYTMQAGGNLEEIYYPQSTQVVQLTNQTYLHTVGLPSTNPCKNLADVMITNCNAIKTLSSETIVLDFNTLKYVQNLNITNSLSGLNSMHFNGFDKLRNVTLSSLKELDTIGFEDMMPITTTSTLKNITISDCPLITSLSFNVSSDDYKVAFASNGKLDLGGLQSLKSIKCNTSVKGLDTLIVPTSLTDLRFTTEYGDGINEIKNIWSASAVHNNDGFEGIDFQDMTIEFIDMLGLNGISNAINFHIAPKTQNPNLNTARDGSASKPWFHPIGSIDLSNYTGLMIGMLRGVDLNKLDVVINTDRDQVDLTSLFECATLPTAQNIVTKTNNILAKFPKSVIWDYMFKGCDLSFSPKDIRIPNRGLSLKGMYKDSNVTEDVSLPNVIMAVDEMFMNCTGITTYEKNWLKTYSKITYTVPTSNGTSGSWDDSGNYTEGTNYNQFLYTPSTGEKAFKIMTTGTGVVRINYFYNASFMSRVVYTPEFDSYPYVVTIPDGCNKVIFVCDKTIRFASEGTISTSNCYTNTGGALSEIPTSWGGYGLDKNVTSIYVIDTTHLTNTTTFNLVLNDNQAGITDWGDGVTNSEKSHTYAEHGVYTIKTKSWANGTPSDDLKTALIEVKQIKLIGHNGNSKDYSNSFNGCSKLRKVTAYNLAPSNCYDMFRGCSSLTEIVGIDTWNMSNCTDTSGMFAGTGITDFSFLDLVDFGNVNAVEYMFQNTKITSLPIDLYPNFKKITGIFSNCSNLTDISRWNVEQDISRLNFSRVFNACSITELIFNNWTGKFNSGTYMISGLRGLVTFDIRNCDEGGIDMFYDCPNTLTNVYPPKTLKYNMASFSECNKLTADSLVRIINALYDFSTEGGTHTIDIGSTNIAKLTREQMLIAIKKHWTIQGAPIQGVFRDTDISTLTSDDTVTAVAIELTADNYLTRIDEVLGVYTNAVDVYFFDDGSVTTLASMCYNNNTVTKDRIQNVTFIDGYFENCTSLIDAFRETKGLVTVTGIPDNATEITSAFFDASNLKSVSKIPSKCTRFNIAFRGCRSLVSVPTNGWTGNVEATFQYCSLLNQQINIVNPTVLGDIFNGCSALEISPTFTGTYTGKIDRLFKGCEKLTNIVLPTTWRPSSAQSTFIDCTQLVTIENLGALDMSNCKSANAMFENCYKLSNLNDVEGWNVGNLNGVGGMFRSCHSVTTLDLSGWRFWTTTIDTMFYDMSSLQSINLTGWTTSDVQSMDFTFGQDIALEEIIGLNTWNTSNLIKTNSTFGNCKKLRELDLSGWNLSNLGTGDYGNTNSTLVGCTSLTKITLNNITDNGTRGAGVGLRGMLNTIPQPVEIVMNEFAMTDFSNLFQGVTKIKNDIVFPTNATNVSNCFKGCTGMTHIHSNWKTTYDDIVAEDGTVSKIVTTDCYLGCTGITHCDGVDLGINEYTTGLDEVPISWGGFEFSKATTSILELVIPENNYTLTLNPDMILATIDNGEHSGYDIYNRINWGDGTITEGEHSHTYTTAGTYTFKGHYYMGAYEPTSTLKVCLSKIHQIPRYYKAVMYNHRYLAKDCKNLTEVTINNFVTTPNNNGLIHAFNGCTNLQKVTITADMPLYNLRDTFRNCTSLVEINGIETWDTSTTKEMHGAFYNCSQLPYSVLLQLSNTLNFDSCTDASEMFYNDTFDDAIPLQQLKVSNMTHFNSLLSGVKVKGDLDLSMWNVHPTNLTSFLDSAIINGSVNLSGWDVSNCTDFSRMLHWSSASSVNLSGWNFSRGTIGNYSFIGCPASDWNFTGASGIKFDIVMDNPQNHSVDSLVGLFNALYDFASAGDTGTHTITLGSKNLAKLSDEQKMIAVNKCWKLEGYPIIKIASSVDLSSLTADTSITKAIIELTSENATNRIAELYTKFPNITEIYLFENGSITEAVDIFTGVDNSAKAQITKVVFLEGYFNNVTLDMREYGILDELPTAWGGFGFSKDKTFIAELTIPSDNYTIGLGQCYTGVPYTNDNKWCTNFGDGSVDVAYHDGSNYVNTGVISHTYAKAGTYILKTHRLLYQIDTPSRQAFTKIINVHKYLGEWGITEHFNGFTNLIEADLSNLAGIQFNAKGMFSGCSKLVKVTAPNFTPTNCLNMFENCSSLTEIIGIDTWNMSNCTDIDYMFRNCSSLINLNIPNWNVSNISSFAGAFMDCRNLSVLNVSNWRPINANNMQTMFRNCSKLTELNISNWGTLSKVSTLYSTFNGCSSLTELVLPTFTSTLTDMETTFAYCTNLTTLDISNCDLSNVVFRNTFNTTTNLTNISSGTNISDNIIFSNCNKLTVTSLLSIINNLATVSNSKTLTLGSTNLAKLTDEQIAIATNKGWTIQ